MQYIKVNPGSAHRGDVIIFKAPTYDERITRGRWQNRFIISRDYMKIIEEPGNNGTIRAKDKHGRKRCRHLADPNIIEVRRPA